MASTRPLELPPSAPRTIEFLIVTFGALTMMRPWTSTELMTWPAWLAVMSPFTTLRDTFGMPVKPDPLGADTRAAVVTVAPTGAAETEDEVVAAGSELTPDPVPDCTSAAACCSAWYW